MRKGQDNHIAVFVNLDRKVPVTLAPSHQQVDLQKALDGWGKEVLEPIEGVSIDLSGNYRGFLEKYLPKAYIVADRFHVMKLVNQELTKTRNKLRKTNQSNPDRVEQAQIESALKQSKYALLKPEEKLTERQQVKLQEIQTVVPFLARMHEQKESFINIFEESTNWQEGRNHLLQWILHS